MEVSTRSAGRSGFSPEETARLIEEALGQLNDKQLEAIEFIYFEGLTFAEAAQKAVQSPAQLRHNYYRGLTRMREFIESKRPREDTQPSPVAATAIRLEVANVKPRAI